MSEGEEDGVAGRDAVGGEWFAGGRESGISYVLALVAHLRDYAVQFDCYIHPSSRITAFEALLKTGRVVEEAERLVHGCRDVQELLFICDTLAPVHPDELKRALPILLQGSVLPSEEGEDQRPRSLQFELHIAAELVRAGFTVALEEPDVVFVHQGDALGIAAKRPISRNKVGKRVREAVRQLARYSERGGIVALSLDRLLDGQCFVAGGVPGTDNAARELLLSAFRPYAARVQAGSCQRL